MTKKTFRYITLHISTGVKTPGQVEFDSELEFLKALDSWNKSFSPDQVTWKYWSL